MKKKKTLVETLPHLLKEWNYKKNVSGPEKYTIGSNKKVWWICDKGHEWESIISNRAKGYGRCPYCVGRLPSEINNLKKKNPKIAAEWHPTKNGLLGPEHYLSGSNVKVWWKCKYEHEYEAKIYNRVNGRGCPYCAGKKAGYGNDLKTKYPELAKEWHPTKNVDLNPKDVTPGSTKMVWWKCDNGHEWEATVGSRKSGSRCPLCNKGSQTSFPEQLFYFYLKKHFPNTENRKIFIYNDEKVEVDIFIPELNLPIEYDGFYFHNNQTKNEIKKNNVLKQNGMDLLRIREKDLSNQHLSRETYYRRKTIGDSNIGRDIVDFLKVLGIKNPSVNLDKDRIVILQYLSLYEINKSLFKVNPRVSKEWHPTKNNGLSPKNFRPNSNKKVWWQCSQGHEWEAIISHRNKGLSCPYCNGTLPNENNNLKRLQPKIASEWHPMKNGLLKPENYLQSSNKKVWWICKKGHEWEAKISNRTQLGNGCPFCSNQKVGYGNDLNTKYPNISMEWHPTKNKELKPNNVIPGSNKRVWWICKKGHEWKAKISSRIHNESNCPYCSNQRVGYGNDLATQNPSLAKEWHPTGNGILTPGDVVTGSHKKVWWQCENGHEWEAVINSRIKGNGCPYCSGKKASQKYNLANEYPDLTKEWHLVKNALTPNDVTPSSGKKVWWICDKGHEWEATIDNRTRRFDGCPYCSGRYPTKENNLEKKFPDISADWDYSKNGNLSPSDFKSKSGKKVWWRCKNSHELERRICDRVKSNGCTECKRSTD